MSFANFLGDGHYLVISSNSHLLNTCSIPGIVKNSSMQQESRYKWSLPLRVYGLVDIDERK